eukprot:6339237-Prymnesium_polylepis.1
MSAEGFCRPRRRAAAKCDAAGHPAGRAKARQTASTRRRAAHRLPLQPRARRRRAARNSSRKGR